MFIKRTILNTLKYDLSSPEISLIVGPRQAGKTTIMRKLQESLTQEREKTLFLNLDVEADKYHFTSQEKLLQKIRLEFGDNKGYVFIDEIQRKQNAGIFLKGLYDLQIPYKFIVSGSGSLELKESIHESLAGRKRLFELTTLSFLEFLNFKTNSQYEKQLIDFCRSHPEKLAALIEEYMQFGGYPKVALASTISDKYIAMNEIYRSYIERDAVYLLGIQKQEAFENLIKTLACQTGQLINIRELSSTLGIAAQTVKQYLWYLQKTYIIEKTTPYFKNIRKEITKTPIMYFTDLGMRNLALGTFSELGKIHTTDGFLFENFIAITLKERLTDSSRRLHFWRTKDGAEVDFVIEYRNSLVPIEVKDTRLTLPIIPPSLKSYIAKYKPAQAYVINRSLDRDIKKNNTLISFVPFYELLEGGKVEI